MGLFSGGGFFGSGGKANSGNTTSDTKASSINVDNQDGEIGNSIALGTTTDSTLNITTTDFGAIDTAGDIAQASIGLANESMGFAGEAFDDLTGTLSDTFGVLAGTLKSGLNDSLTTARAVASDAVGVSQSATQDEGARTAQLIVISVGVLGVALLFRNKFKG